jgi:F-type H+-transporting ATPase subunit gamma
MSKRRDVEGRIESLRDIHGIMDSMKNLALMETRKLARYHEAQQQVVASISLALNAVRQHFTTEASWEEVPPVYLLVGSERGFCGAYNEQVLAVLAQQPDHDTAPLIAIGSRLANPIQRVYPRASCLPGAAVADEIDEVLAALATTLDQLRQQHGPLRLEVIHFQPDVQQAQCQSALPTLESASAQGLPPIINLPPQQLLGALLEQYLFALTHAWLFESLMAENQRRVQHLDQAGHHLEQRMDELGKRRNMLRQEEIIEEIEVILLSAASLDDNPGKRAPTLPAP